MKAAVRRCLSQAAFGRTAPLRGSSTDAASVAMGVFPARLRPQPRPSQVDFMVFLPISTHPRPQKTIFDGSINSWSIHPRAFISSSEFGRCNSSLPRFTYRAAGKPTPLPPRGRLRHLWKAGLRMEMSAAAGSGKSEVGIGEER